MADISITATGVTKGAGAVTERGTAGATLTAGMAVYKDAATGTYKIAHCETSAATAVVAGLALNGASSGQPVEVQTQGIIALNGLTVGTIYVLSASGAIAPAADLASGDYVTVIGVGATSANLDLGINDSGVQVPA